MDCDQFTSLARRWVYKCMSIIRLRYIPMFVVWEIQTNAALCVYSSIVYTRPIRIYIKKCRDDMTLSVYMY